MTAADPLLAAFAARDLAYRVSPNFTVRELVDSPTARQAGIDNWPADGRQPFLAGVAVVRNLGRLATTLLEPVRALAGRPVRSNCGYRCEDLNDLLGGAAVKRGDREDSGHLFGLADDLEAPGLDNMELARRIAAEMKTGALRGVVDQLILEGHRAGVPDSGWIHASVAALGATPRGEILTAHGKRYVAGLVALA